MSYREEDGQVILTMSREDYEQVLLLFGACTVWAYQLRTFLTLEQVLSLLNRLNEGNPNYTPYQVEAKK